VVLLGALINAYSTTGVITYKVNIMPLLLNGPAEAAVTAATQFNPIAALVLLAAVAITASAVRSRYHHADTGEVLAIMSDYMPPYTSLTLPNATHPEVHQQQPALPQPVASQPLPQQPNTGLHTTHYNPNLFTGCRNEAVLASEDECCEAVLLGLAAVGVLGLIGAGGYFFATKLLHISGVAGIGIAYGAITAICCTAHCFEKRGGCAS
jgi:hypothetical protein